MNKRKNKPTVFREKKFMQRLIIKFCIYLRTIGTIQTDEINDISSDQGEADTKMFLCAKYCILLGASSVFIHKVEADVLALSFYYSAHVNCHFLLTLNLPV